MTQIHNLGLAAAVQDVLDREPIAQRYYNPWILVPQIVCDLERYHLDVVDEFGLPIGGDGCGGYSLVCHVARFGARHHRAGGSIFEHAIVSTRGRGTLVFDRPGGQLLKVSPGAAGISAMRLRRAQL